MKSDKMSSDRIMQLGQAFQGAKTLLSAVELGVFAALVDGPLDLESVRERIQINERGTRDFLDALVALGMLARQDGRYANTAETAFYLDPSKPSYIGGALTQLNDQLFGTWASLSSALRTGKPKGGAGATGSFPALYADPKALEVFASGMTARTWPVAKALAAKVPWSDYRTSHRHRRSGGVFARSNRSGASARHWWELRSASDEASL